MAEFKLGDRVRIKDSMLRTEVLQGSFQHRWLYDNWEGFPEAKMFGLVDRPRWAEGRMKLWVPRSLFIAARKEKLYLESPNQRIHGSPLIYQHETFPEEGIVTRSRTLHNGIAYYDEGNRGYIQDHTAKPLGYEVTYHLRRKPIYVREDQIELLKAGENVSD